MLDSEHYESWLVTDARYRDLLGAVEHFVPLQCLSNRVFLKRLSRGKPIFDIDSLLAAVHEDQRILRDISPNLVVGDFRVSLSISCRLLSIPYIAITDSYWSPYAQRPFPLPDLPLRKIGSGAAELLYRIFRPLAFALHARPINHIRQRFGLASVGWDLCHAYTDADHVMYCDVPELIEKRQLPRTHHHIGPIMFEPDVPVPEWWNRVPDQPCVYVSLGTSGRRNLLRDILAALGTSSVNLLIATAGDPTSSMLLDRTRYPNVFSADFLPGMLTAARSELVICNGGSGATQQAMTAGKPVLGLASNMDQLMNMTPIVTRGAGLVIGSWNANPARIRKAAEYILAQAHFRQNAERIRSAIACIDSREAFPRVVDQIVGMPVRKRDALTIGGNASSQIGLSPGSPPTPSDC
jgi:UDP:flavonoid glycosyltransferase YjiC (YdhE family)